MTSILHIDSEATWRGGQNQVLLLIEGMLRLQSATGFAPALACLQGSALALKARQLGLTQIVELPKPFLSFRNLRLLRRCCKTWNVALVDAHSSRAHSLALLLNLLLPALKVVIHRRVDYIPGFWSRAKYRAAGIDLWVAISESIRQILVEKIGIEPERCCVVRSAIDVAFYHNVSRALAREALCQDFSLSADVPILISAGAFTSQKRFDILLQSLATLHLQDQALPWQAILFGDGPQLASLQQQTRDLKLEKRVCLPGFVEDPRRYLPGADIFVLSSEYEGLGTILLEAAAAGLPTIATAVGGIPEILLPGKTGILVPPLSTVELTKAMITLLGDESLRFQMGATARTHVAEKFSLQSMIHGNLAEYARLVQAES